MNLNINKSDWIKVKLNDVCEWYQKNIPNDEQINFGIEYYVTANHIDSDSIKFDRYSELADGQKGPTITKHFEKGDLLLSTRSVALRKAALAPVDGVTGEKLLVLRVKPESLLLRELMPFVFQSIDFWKYAQNSASGSVNKFTSWTKIREYEFLLPPKDQQAQLAKLLWAMDEVIEKKIKTNEKLQASYVTTIEKELLNRKSDKLYFGDILNVIRGVGYKPAQLLDEYDSNCCIVLRSNNISNGLINFDEIRIVPSTLIKESQYLIDGDFAICMSNGSKELVGKCAEFRTSERNFSIGSFCASLRPKNEEYRQLLRHLVNSESYRVAIKRTLTGSAINNLKPSDIEELFLRVNLSSSESVLKKLDIMTKNRLQLDEAVKTSKSLQKSLINQVF